ncbi:hypothetical protein ABVT39_009423 [Epinephelus coioides]
MSPLTLAEPELSCLRSELRSIEGLLDDVLQRQSLLLTRMEALQRGASISTNAAVPGTSAVPSPSWATVARKSGRVSLPLFTPGSDDNDEDSIPLSNFFAPLEKLTEHIAICSHTARQQPALLGSQSRKRRTPPSSPQTSKGKRPRCLSPPSLSDAESWPSLPVLQSSLPRQNTEPVTSRGNDDVIGAGVSSSPDIPDAPVNTHLSLPPKLAVYDDGCKNQPPEILIIGDSIIRNVHLPGSITYCLSGGKTTDFVELMPSIIDLHPTVQTVLIHAGTNDVMSRQSTQLHYDLESLVNTVESLGKICVLSGPIPTMLKSSERFSRLFSLHLWMHSFATATGLGFISNFDYFWTERDLFKSDGLHLNRMGTERLSRNFINFIAFSLK